MAELNQLLLECANPNWNGHGSLPVSERTIACARAFLETLSAQEQPTDINTDPDGEITFDWHDAEILLAISISADGRLSYIYRKGDYRERDTLFFEENSLPAKLRALIPVRTTKV